MRTDTALAGAIATAGGGLVRKAASNVHASGAASYTLTGSYTAKGSDVLPVTIAKMGMFNSRAGGRIRSRRPWGQRNPDRVRRPTHGDGYVHSDVAVTSRCPFGGSTRAGFPTAVQPAGTSQRTTAPAPILAIANGDGANDNGPRADVNPLAYVRASAAPPRHLAIPEGDPL